MAAQQPWPRPSSATAACRRLRKHTLFQVATRRRGRTTPRASLSTRIFVSWAPHSFLVFSLGGNNISNAGAIAIAKALERNSSLASLACVFFQHHPTSALRSVVPFSLLSHVLLLRPFSFVTQSLDTNAIYGDGMAAIGKALELNTGLEKLEYVKAAFGSCRPSCVWSVGTSALGGASCAHMCFSTFDEGWNSTWRTTASSPMNALPSFSKFFGPPAASPRTSQAPASLLACEAATRTGANEPMMHGHDCDCTIPANRLSCGIPDDVTGADGIGQAIADNRSLLRLT